MVSRVSSGLQDLQLWQGRRREVAMEAVPLGGIGGLACLGLGETCSPD